MKTYAEKLKDPRWQRKRLEIMQRDQFQCGDCGAENSTLSVHHTYYISGRMPWEYPDWSLRTLCEQCHKGSHSDGPKELNFESVMGFFLGSGECGEFAESSAFDIAAEFAKLVSTTSRREASQMTLDAISALRS